MHSEKCQSFCDNLTFDVGGMGIKVIRFSNSGCVIDDDYINYEFDKGGYTSLKNVLDLIVSYIAPFKETLNVGICFPGLVDINKKEILSESFIHEFYEINIETYIKNICPNIQSFVIENDAKSAAIGELNFGLANKYKDCALVTVGSAIGGALILNSELRNGPHFLTGEFSKIYSNLEKDDERVLAHCGSTMALQRQYAELSKQNLSDVNGKLIMEKYNENEKIAVSSLKQITNNLARALFAIFTIVDVEAFLIGGGISENDDFIHELKKSFESCLINQKLKCIGPQIVKCKLANRAGCYGMLHKLLKEENKHES